jgi:hypothetical protein
MEELETDPATGTPVEWVIARRVLKLQVNGMPADEFCRPFSAKEMRHLFNVGNDHLMLRRYIIKTPEQIAYFKSMGVPIESLDYYDYFIEAEDLR